MAAAVCVRIGAELKLAICFERLNPALDGTGNGRVGVVDSAIYDGYAHPGATAITPHPLHARGLLGSGPSVHGIERPRRLHIDHVAAAVLAAARACKCANLSATSARFTLSVGVSGKLSSGHTVWRRICWCGARRWFAARTISETSRSAPLASSRTACTSVSWPCITPR